LTILFHLNLEIILKFYTAENEFKHHKTTVFTAT